MKRIVYLSVLFLGVVSCGDRNGYTVKGVYDSAPDNTVVYMSRYMVSEINDMLVPFDSAVVRNGRFAFKGTCEKAEVCFVSSSKVVDGGYVVIEPGVIDFDMTARGVRGGTELNGRMNRFLNEKERLIALRGMCEPAILDVIAPTEEMRDSVVLMASLAGKVFDLYVSNSFHDNAGNGVGHFILTQSVGFASPYMLSELFEKVPMSFRDKIYELKKKYNNNIIEREKKAQQYIVEAAGAAVETAVGKKYIDFELNGLSGGKVLFSDVVTSCDYTLLLFWGAWDDNASAFMRSFEALRGVFGSNELGLVTISLDASVDNCAGAVSVTDGSVIHLCNPAGGSAEVASGYGVTGLPYALLVNRKGTILLRTNSIKDIESKLQELF